MEDLESSKPESSAAPEMAGRQTKRSRSQSGSFLVRFWVEPAAGPGEHAIRGCIKNLQTGEEHYLKDPDKIGDLVLRQLGSQGKAEETAKNSVPEKS